MEPPTKKADFYAAVRYALLSDTPASWETEWNDRIEDKCHGIVKITGATGLQVGDVSISAKDITETTPVLLRAIDCESVTLDGHSGQDPCKITYTVYPERVAYQLAREDGDFSIHANGHTYRYQNRRLTKGTHSQQ